MGRPVTILTRDYISCKSFIGVHSIMYLMHPNYAIKCKFSVLVRFSCLSLNFVLNLCSESAIILCYILLQYLPPLSISPEQYVPGNYHY